MANKLCDSVLQNALINLSYWLIITPWITLFN